MSVKTDRLSALLPDAYGAGETESLLHRVLDAVGAELGVADDKVKRLLKSHWVDYAEGGALDGLGQIYGVERRLTPTGEPEPDDGFRRRLRAVVPLFTGGGTKRAVRGAVQSALGLPFDFATLNLPPELGALRADLERLVVLDEFPVTAEHVDYGVNRLVVEPFAPAGGLPGGPESVIYVDLATSAAAATPPGITWRMISAGATELSVELLGSKPRAGVRSEPSLVLGAGEVVEIGSSGTGALTAVLAGGTDISSRFGPLTPGGEVALPAVPTTPSRWRFAARGGRLDVARFDESSFDSPRFGVAVSWSRPQLLVFDLTVPWTAKAAVEAIVARHAYNGSVFLYEGLGQDAVKQVVEQSRAAGVRANLYFSVFAEEDQDAHDALSLGERQAPEDAGAHERLRLDGAARVPESQDVRESFGFAAEFDVATFDGPFVLT